jgi:hypothetical protein
MRPRLSTLAPIAAALTIGVSLSGAVDREASALQRTQPVSVSHTSGRHTIRPALFPADRDDGDDDINPERAAATVDHRPRLRATPANSNAILASLTPPTDGILGSASLAPRAPPARRP